MTRTRSIRSRCIFRLEALEARDLPGFLAPVSYPVGNGPIRTTVADLNADGRRDIALLNNSGVVVLLGDGNGALGAPATYSSGPNPVWLRVADLNTDGKFDIVTANEAANGSASVLLGNGDGTFQPRTDYASGGTKPLGVSVGDLNGDGKPDLAVANTDYFGDNGFGKTVGVLYGNGDGTFQPA